MEKAGVIIRDALAELQTAQREQSLKPVDFNTGVRYLNRMLDSWLALGIDLGTSRVQLPDDYLDIPDAAVSGVIFNLAIELANRFGYPISQSLATVAAKHYQSIVRLFSVKPSSYSNNLPRGSGNALASESEFAFYTGDEAIPDTSGEHCALEIIQSDTPPANPKVGTLWLDTSKPSGNLRQQVDAQGMQISSISDEIDDLSAELNKFVVSSAEPLDSDGRPDGTIYFWVLP